MTTNRSNAWAPFVLSNVLVLIGFAVRADDWPQWRGQNRDGIWRETGILQSIPPSGLPIRWRVKVNNGYAGPVVAQGRVFVTDHVFDPEVERVLCFDATTGKQIWVQSYSVSYRDMEYGNGPRAAPTVHDGKVYSLGTQGHLHCLDAVRGDVIWKKDLVADLHGQIPRYGASAAPLIAGDLLIVCAGGSNNASVVALDRLTGELRWSQLSDRPAYSAPCLIHAGDVDQVIVWTGDAINSLDPKSGRVYWQIPWKATFDPAQMVASPVRHNDKLLLMGAWSRGSKMLKLDASKPAASILWETGTKPTTTISTPIFPDDNYFYGILGNGALACLEAATGKEVWATREPTSGGYGNAHLTPNGVRVFLFNHTGHLILAELTKDGYREHGRCLLIEPTAGFRAQDPITWAHPAYANKCVFARNDRELICVSLAATDQPPPPATVSNVAPFRVFNQFDKEAAFGLAFAPDGRSLALGLWSGVVKIMDVTTDQDKELPAPKPHKDWVCAVAFSADGKFLVSAGGSEFKPERNAGQTTGQIKLWDVAGKKELGEFIGHSNKVFSIALSSDSKWLVSGSADQTVRLWEVATRSPRFVLGGHQDAVWSVAFSSNREMVASSSADRTVKLWSTASGKEIGSWRGHNGDVRCVAFSPDGTLLATGGTDSIVRLWNPATQKVQASLRGHDGSIRCLAFTSDSLTLITGSGDETIKIWDLSTRKERMTLRGHRSGISALALSPNNQTLASAGMDDAVRLWKIRWN